MARPKKKAPKRGEQRETKQKAPFGVYFVYFMPEKTTESEDVVALCVTRQISIRKHGTTLKVRRKTVTEAIRRYKHAVGGSGAWLPLWAERCGFCASVAVAICRVHCIDSPQ